MLMSRNIINSTLTQPGIAKLPMIAQQDEPIEWLQKNLEVQFLPESEVLEISLSGDHPDDLAKVVNAVKQVYFDKVVERDRSVRTSRQETLRKLTDTYKDLTKTRRETLRKLVQNAGSDDKSTLVLKQQFAVEHLAAVRRDLHEVQSKKRQLEAMLKVQHPEALQETAAPAVSAAEVERMIEQDGDVVALRARLADMQDRLDSESAHTGRVARNASLNPALKSLHDEVEHVKKQLDKKRKAIRPLVIRQLQNPEDNGPAATGGGGLHQQLAVYQEVEKTLQDEFDKLTQDDKARTAQTLDLQDMQDELKQYQDALNKISNEGEMLRVELEAPPRISHD